jgi:hypothetical protein
MLFVKVRVGERMARRPWPRLLTEAERSAILDDQVERFARDGWRLLRRTPTSALITRPKRVSVGTAICWALCLLIGLAIYLLVFASRRDPVGRLVVGDDGRVHGEWSDGGEYWPELPGDWACRRCTYRNLAQHGGCTRCDMPRGSPAS